MATESQDINIAADDAEEAWKIHGIAMELMDPGQKLPTAKQLEAAYRSFEYMEEQVQLIQQTILEVRQRIGQLEQSADALQKLAEHVTGKKL